MELTTIIISGLSALFGTLGAMSFQLWREKHAWQQKGDALINQLISLIQHQRLVLEVFDENHNLFTGTGNFQTPSPAPEAMIASSLIVDVAEHLNKKDFETFSTAISSYDSFYKHTYEMRDYHSEMEARMVSSGSTSPSRAELDKLSKYSKNYKGILKSNIETHNKVQKILSNALENRSYTIFDRNHALRNKPALILLYIVIVSYLAIIFGYLHFYGKNV